MKTKSMSLSFLLTLAFSNVGAANTTYTESDILGVWKLTKFVTTEANGTEQDWCNGATGSLAYLPGLMTVAINCESTTPNSNAENIGGYLFYSGPFEVDTQKNQVIHRVRNYSHPSLLRVVYRKIEMSDANHLRLVGPLANGQDIVIEWERKESFAYNDHELLGVYELVGSENEVEGSSEKIPFCTGFYGTIVYTPGGFNAVSINCGEKKDPNVVEPADMFGRKFFYTSKYELNVDRVVHHLVNASEVTTIGTDSHRAMSMKEDVLSLAGTNGSKFVAKWRKLKSFVGLKN